MNTTIQSLLALYQKLGGSLTDTYSDIADGIAVGDYVTIPDAIAACAKIAGSGGGGGGSSFIVTLTEDSEHYEADKTAGEIYAAWEAGTPVYINYDGIRFPLISCEKTDDSYYYAAVLVYVSEDDTEMRGFSAELRGESDTTGWEPMMLSASALPSASEHTNNEFLVVNDGAWSWQVYASTIENAFQESGGVYTSQRTLAQIASLWASNKNIYGYNQATGYKMPLVYCDNDVAIFSATAKTAASTYKIMTMEVTASGCTYTEAAITTN